MTCGKEDIPLDHVGPNFGGGEEIGGKRKREKREREEEEGERSSIFSLDLTVIGPLAFVGARDKVRLHDEGFT